MAIIINGRQTAQKIHELAGKRAIKLKEKGIIPRLAVILVGDDPASVSYITGKKNALAKIGMEDRDIRLPAGTSERELLGVIESLNKDPEVHGILVQLPLPLHISGDKIVSAIDPAKDVDGFHPVSAGSLLQCRPGFIPCTPLGIIHLLKDWKVPFNGKHAVIIGRSNIVGRPLANLLIRKEHNVTVTICHTGTRDISVFTRQADIVIAAAGSPGLVKPDMIKPGAAIIDVGVNRIEDASRKRGFRLEGDADFNGLLEKAGWITPVPGGVGPMTIAMLMSNVADAAEGTVC